MATSFLVNVISCPSPLSVSHRHSCTRCVYFPEILRGLHHQLPQLDKAAGYGGEKESEQDPRRSPKELIVL